MIKNNKKIFILSLIFYCIGACISIAFSQNIENPKSDLNIINLLINNSYKFFKPFFIFLIYSILGLSISILCIKRKLRIIPYLFYLLLGYTFASKVIECILTGIISGIISSIIFIFPIYTSIYMGIFISNTLSFNQNEKDFSYYCKNRLIKDGKILAIISLHLLFYLLLLPFILSIFI